MVAHYLMIMGTPRYLSQVLKEPAREQPSGRGYGQKGSDPLRRISLYPGSTLGESSLPSTTYRRMILSAAGKLASDDYRAPQEPTTASVPVCESTTPRLHADPGAISQPVRDGRRLSWPGARRDRLAVGRSPHQGVGAPLLRASVRQRRGCRLAVRRSAHRL